MLKFLITASIIAAGVAAVHANRDAIGNEMTTRLSNWTSRATDVGTQSASAADRLQTAQAKEDQLRRKLTNEVLGLKGTAQALKEAEEEKAIARKSADSEAAFVASVSQYVSQASTQTSAPTTLATVPTSSAVTAKGPRRPEWIPCGRACDCRQWWSVEMNVATGALRIGEQAVVSPSTLRSIEWSDPTIYARWVSLVTTRPSD